MEHQQLTLSGSLDFMRKAFGIDSVPDSFCLFISERYYHMTIVIYRKSIVKRQAILLMRPFPPGDVTLHLLECGVAAFFYLANSLADLLRFFSAQLNLANLLLDHVSNELPNEARG